MVQNLAYNKILTITVDWCFKKHNHIFHLEKNRVYNTFIILDVCNSNTAGLTLKIQIMILKDLLMQK